MQQGRSGERNKLVRRAFQRVRWFAKQTQSHIRTVVRVNFVAALWRHHHSLVRVSPTRAHRVLGTREAYSAAWMEDRHLYGCNEFEWHILETRSCTAEEARGREREYINHHNAEDLGFGYNGGWAQELRNRYVEPDLSSFLKAKELRQLLRGGLVMYHDYRPAGTKIEPGGWLGRVVFVVPTDGESSNLTIRMEYLHDDGRTEEWVVNTVGNRFRCGLTKTRVLARLPTDDEMTRWLISYRRPKKRTNAFHSR